MAVAEIASSVVQLLTAIMEYRRFLAEQQRQQQQQQMQQQRDVGERQLEFAQSVGERQFDVRSELAEQSMRLDPQRTREVQDQLYAQYRQDNATWNQSADPQWWQHASTADIADVWRASTAWQDIDPGADMARRAAADRLTAEGVRLPVHGPRAHSPEALSQAVRSAAERQGHTGERAGDQGRMRGQAEPGRSAADPRRSPGRGPDGRPIDDRSSSRFGSDGRAGADAQANWHRGAAASDRVIAGQWREEQLDTEQSGATASDTPAHRESHADHAHAEQQAFTAEAAQHERLADVGQAAGAGEPSPAAAPQTAEGHSAQAAARAYPAATRAAVGKSAVQPAGARGVAGRGSAQPQRPPMRAPQPAVPSR